MAWFSKKEEKGVIVEFIDESGSRQYGKATGDKMPGKGVAVEQQTGLAIGMKRVVTPARSEPKR